MKTPRIGCIGALFLVFISANARAQLASSFYNLTRVETKVFPNALQVTIHADGVLSFGADYAEIVDIGENRFAPRQLSSFRLRFLGARSKLPTVVPIGKYPLDSIQVAPGREAFKNPVFGNDGGNADPQTDLTFQFFAPVTLRDLKVENYNALPFGDYLNPLDVRVEKGNDPSTVIVTIVPDRVDTRAALLEVNRVITSEKSASPSSLSNDEKTKIIVAQNPDKTFRIEALHAPLSELLDTASRAMSTSILADADLAKARVSLHLPHATLDELLATLETGNDLISTREAGQIRLSRGGASTPATVGGFERIALQNLRPAQARALLPDFLFPFLRPDLENNALLIYGSPRLAARVRSDLSTLDGPRALVKVEATAWEITVSGDDNTALQLMNTLELSGANAGIALDTSSGQFSFQIDAAAAQRFKTTLQALSQRGRAKLIAQPSLVVASGERGSLFLGQTRFVPVLSNEGGGQNLKVLKLAIGYELTVKPVVGAGEEISLEVNPRLSTVDEIAKVTGLPTISIRESSTNLRVRAGDTILLGGLESDLQFDSKLKTFVRSKRDSQTQISLLVLLRVEKIESQRHRDTENF